VAALTQKRGLNALSLIPDPRTKLPFVIAEFHFDPLCLRAFEGIEARPPQQ
jgi:hypothetical protein